MKVLIIKLGALGDIIFSTSVIQQIIEHHSNDEVHLLTTPTFQDLFKNFKSLNVTAFNRKGLINSLKSIAWIRKQKFDRIYDLQSNDRTSIYCALSNVPYRAGNHPRFPYHVHPEQEFHGECHAFDRLNQIIESANIKLAEPLPFLPIPEAITNDVENWLRQNNLNDSPYIIFHAGSSPVHIKKRWPYYSQLALQLKQNFNIVWIGSDDDAELNKNLSTEYGVDATNEFSILGLVELGKKAKFAITNDSAPMHILSCSQIPVFGLFGPTYPRRTHALGQLDNVITAQKSIANDDLSFKPQPISEISVKDVLDKLKERNLI